MYAGVVCVHLYSCIAYLGCSCWGLLYSNSFVLQTDDGFEKLRKNVRKNADNFRDLIAICDERCQIFVCTVRICTTISNLGRRAKSRKRKRKLAGCLWNFTMRNPFKNWLHVCTKSTRDQLGIVSYDSSACYFFIFRSKIRALVLCTGYPASIIMLTKISDYFTINLKKLGTFWFSVQLTADGNGWPTLSTVKPIFTSKFTLM